MSDIFREVEEDVRRERAEKIWKRYGTYIIAAGVLVFVGIGGWQLWQRYDRQEREKISAQFVAAQRISNPRDAANAFVDLAGGKGYGEIARLSQASAMFAAGQRKEAIDLYKEIAARDNGPVGSVARLRAAWALAETASRSELTELLKPLDKPGSPEIGADKIRRPRRQSRSARRAEGPRQGDGGLSQDRRRRHLWQRSARSDPPAPARSEFREVRDGRV